MIKNIMLSFYFVSLIMLPKTFEIEKNTWVDFDGQIGKENIQLSLYRFENGEIEGNYCYKKYETKIQLIGKIVGEKIELNEILNNKVNGHFQGKIFTDTFDKFEGKWSDSSNKKTSNFKLKLNSINGGTFKHRYLDFYGTDNDVEIFMKKVKKSIIEDDKEWISNHISYPIKTKIDTKKTIIIKSKKELINNFNKIFNKEFKEQIKSFCSCNLFHNYQGVMLGNGQIWIENKPNSTNTKYDFQIKAINN